LINKVDPLPAMINSVRNYFEFLLLKEELSVAFFVLDVLCLVADVDTRRQKICYIRYYERDN